MDVSPPFFLFLLHFIVFAFVITQKPLLIPTPVKCEQYLKQRFSVFCLFSVQFCNTSNYNST